MNAYTVMTITAVITIIMIIMFIIAQSLYITLDSASIAMLFFMHVVRNLNEMTEIFKISARRLIGIFHCTRFYPPCRVIRSDIHFSRRRCRRCQRWRRHVMRQMLQTSNKNFLDKSSAQLSHMWFHILRQYFFRQYFLLVVVCCLRLS